MDILFVIGLPRSGTSLVYNLIHKETGRLAPALSDVGLAVPEAYKDFHKCPNLAEIHDLPGTLEEQREWLERRGDRWVVKSVNLQDLPHYMDIYPEARFLVCVRSAGRLMASVQEYFQVTGLRWPYSPTQATKALVSLAKTHGEKFDYVDVESLPQWHSYTEPTRTLTVMEIKNNLDTLQGVAKRVEFSQFKDRY